MLPPGHSPDLLWPRWRDHRAAVVSPKMSSGYLCCVASVTNHHPCGVVDEMFELEDAGMELEAVVPTLPVLSEGSYPIRYFVSVGTYVPTDWEHCTVYKTKWCCRG